MITAVKRRVTITLQPGLLKALDRAPGANRSEKIERLLAEALTRRAHARWVAELRTFYRSPAARDERKEDAIWQAMFSEAFERDE